MGTKSLNIGDTTLLWQGSTALHPVIGQGLYRYKTEPGSRPGGRFEQIGMSWLKHGFASDTGSPTAAPARIRATNQIMGVGCSDPYSAGQSGGASRRSRRAGRSTRTPACFPYLVREPVVVGQRRTPLRVAADGNPSSRGSAAMRYYAECHVRHVRRRRRREQQQQRQLQGDERHRTPTNYTFATMGSTQQGIPAIRAWPLLVQPGVTLSNVQVPGDGRLYVARKVNDPRRRAVPLRVRGLQHELAPRVQRVRSRSRRARVSNVGFHDVDYHRRAVQQRRLDLDAVGPRPRHLVDETQAQNANANALRWGTTYNFRFDSDRAPAPGLVALTLFRAPAAGEPTTFSVNLPVPGGTGLFRDDFETGTESAWDAKNP